MDRTVGPFAHLNTCTSYSLTYSLSFPDGVNSTSMAFLSRAGVVVSGDGTRLIFFFSFGNNLQRTQSISPLLHSSMYHDICFVFFWHTFVRFGAVGLSSIPMLRRLVVFRVLPLCR